MSKVLTLEISEPLYETILKRAVQYGQTQENIIITWIEKAAKPPTKNDPLLQLAGIFQSNLTDIGEQHNEYLGKQLTK
jgi:hypothetical protein